MTTSAFRSLLITTILIGALGQTLPQARAQQQDSSNKMQPGQMRATQMLGNPVYGANNQPVGQLVEFIVNPDGSVANVIIGVADPTSSSAKNVAVPMNALHNGGDHLIVDRTVQQMQQAGGYDFGQNPLRGNH